MNSDIIVYNYMDTFYCCCVDNDKLCEDMVTDHMLVYICSGEMILQSKDKRTVFKKGDSVFIKRNHLIRKTKQPSKNGESFKGLFLQLRTPFLKSLIADQHLMIPMLNNSSISNTSHIILPNHPFLNGLFLSLEQYFSTQQYPSKELMDAKLEEAVFALLQIKPELGCVLFDFTEPWKIDLEDFMNRNYKCDLSVEAFAHYTGRSLTSFKRDFAVLFNETPSRWLIKRRLEEAYALLSERKYKPSDVYLEVGFKNLSHFSTAFKKEYGCTPSNVG
ncbi:AraC family transcriptional regulator [uncultured Bacteroides sp.]|uniref:helix-turn-helix domain-containing protein n=1 Tax=uncultured Bacteroides sp. TaxID=162156 RepID=UPI002AA66B3D|nr:AraC family transcriptional regulator [uncultured Bacteroides sp.]